MAREYGENTSQTPLAGVVTCCTSIEPEKRGEFSAMIEEMGGTNKLDLTSDVTHLIVGGYDTAKYKYVAKERPDVKCLLPDWIEAVRESWMNAEETDVEALEMQHRVPTFKDMKISVTGFQDLTQRKQLEQLIVDNGGEYRGDLTKEVTHLIAHIPQGAKYTHGKQWGISVVGIEWLWQSIERGMILEEILYDPLLEQSERGKGAWVRRTSSTTTLGKRSRVEGGKVGNPTRKLRRTASAKFSAQNESLWGDIVGGGFTPKEAKKNAWEDDLKPLPVPCESFARPPAPLGEQEPEDPSLKKSSHKKGLFGGSKFFLSGFDKRKASILEKHLGSSNATIVTDRMELSQSTHSDSPPSSFVLVPHTSSQQDIPQNPDLQQQPVVVNELWLEHCLHSKIYIEPESSAIYKPFHPINGFAELSISSTGFDGIQLSHIGKTIRRLGATYAGTLTKEVSALLCHDKASPNREKVQYALKWNVPIVKADWLEDSMRTGQLKSLWDYLVYPTRQGPPKEENSGELEDVDFRIPKRTQKGPRRRELDYGNGAKTWMRRKDSDSKSEATGPAEETKAKKTHTEPASIEDSFTQPPVTVDTTVNTGELNDDTASIDDTTTLDDAAPMDMPAPSLKTGPLKEMSANSPPKQSSPPKAPLKDPALSSAISSLLANRKSRDAITPSAIDTRPSFEGRRRRKMLGRASSNLSSRSHMSRASSVDTLNTDGVGTPVDLGPNSANTVSTRDPLTEALLDDRAETNIDEPEEAPPMTQVGYHEEEAEKFREKIARNMGWTKGEANVETAAKLQLQDTRTLRSGKSSTQAVTGRKTRQRA